MPNVQSIASRALPRLLALILALAVGATVSLAGAGQANADTPNGRIAHVSLNLTGSAGRSQADAYRQFIQGVQGAAGHAWNPGVGETQTNQAALLRVDVNYDGHTLRLWFTPNNMYLRGFTNDYNQTFAFNDFPLRQAMQDLAEFGSPDARLLPALGAIETLPYGSGYIDLTRAAQRDRGNIQLNYQSILGATYDLLTVRQPNQITARALLLFIQHVAEAARFRPVADMMYDVMNGAFRLGVPPNLQELENSWSALSEWGVLTAAGRHPGPYNVGPNYGTIASARDLVRAMMMILGNLNQAPPTGDFKHTEL